MYSEDPDAKTIGFFAGQGLIGSVLGGAAGVSFDPAKFTYIWRPAKDSRVMVVSPKSGLKTIEYLPATGQVGYAISVVGAADHIAANVLPGILDINAKIITCYKGSSEIQLAVTSGDVEVAGSTLEIRLSTIEDGDQLAVLVLSDEPAEELPETPALLKLDLDDDQRAVAEALEATLANPEFTEQMEKAADVPFEFLRVTSSPRSYRTSSTLLRSSRSS